MKKILGALTGVVGAMALATTAQAEITPANMQALFAAKGLTLAGSEASPDGAVHVLGVTDASGWAYAFSLVDFDGDNRKDIIIMLSMVPGRTAPLELVNSINEAAASKAFITDGNAAMTFLHLGTGSLQQSTLNLAYDIFQTEWNAYRQQVLQQGQGGGNFLGVSLKVDDPYELDAGMTRAEVTARDAALTAALNQTPRAIADVTRHEVSLAPQFEGDLDALFALARATAEEHKANSH